MPIRIITTMFVFVSDGGLEFKEDVIAAGSPEVAFLEAREATEVRCMYDLRGRALVPE
jgi:hypothetical protein